MSYAQENNQKLIKIITEIIMSNTSLYVRLDNQGRKKNFFYLSFFLNPRLRAAPILFGLFKLVVDDERCLVEMMAVVVLLLLLLLLLLLAAVVVAIAGGVIILVFTIGDAGVGDDECNGEVEVEEEEVTATAASAVAVAVAIADP